LVLEACEYGDAFLAFSPTVAVLTNAEWDHPDYFPDRAAVLDSFRRYLSLPSVRVAVVNRDDEGAREAAAGLCVPTVTFGLSEGSELCATDLTKTAEGTDFTLLERGTLLGRVSLRVKGHHNVENALAAAAAARAVGASPRAVLSALSSFPGIGRRLEYRGTLRGVRYYDDYAHHPTEIRASLEALGADGGRVLCVYQPHTYTRTGGLLSEFAAAFSAAERTLITDTYAAREAGDRGPSSRELAAAIGPSALYLGSPELCALWLSQNARAGDTVVVMGAGDVGERFFVGERALGTGE
ncbi:MAG: UDP-N-acetylmuramate--L-alanine ligase, partial [Clostridia bacterium]|nr:UDP-N-acetylmuramate--L-alanine ligase [Clostridia bacterium]